MNRRCPQPGALVLLLVAVLASAGCNRREPFTVRAVYAPISGAYTRLEVVATGLIDSRDSAPREVKVVVTIVNVEARSAELQVRVTRGIAQVDEFVSDTPLTYGRVFDADAVLDFFAIAGVESLAEGMVMEANDVVQAVLAGGLGPNGALPTLSGLRMVTPAKGS